MLKGWKTLIFNAIMTVVMCLRIWGVEVDVDMEQIGSALTMIDTGIVVVWGGGNAILRAITDSPIFKRKEVK